MKKIALVCVFALIAIFMWSSLACLAEKTKPAEENYPWLVQGLKKFNHPRYVNHVVATPIGFSRYSYKEHEKNIEDCEVIELRLVTVDGNYLILKIKLSAARMAVFLQEISPDFSKYFSWNPIIDIYLKLDTHDPGYTHIFALRLAGRFRVDWDRDKNEIKNYKEERYY